MPHLVFALQVSGTNLTINGMFTLDGLSDLPDFAVAAIKEFVDTHATEAITFMKDQFSSKFKATEVKEVKLGFGETPGQWSSCASDMLLALLCSVLCWSSAEYNDNTSRMQLMWRSRKLCTCFLTLMQVHEIEVVQWLCAACELLCRNSQGQDL